MLLVFVVAVVLPVSTVLSILSSFFAYSNEGQSSPTRWLVSIMAPIAVSAWGLQKRSLDYSGALAGMFVGFVLTFSNYCFLAALLCFFVTASKATKFRGERKRILEDNYQEGGRRNWVQVLCNGGMAAEMSLIYLIDRGCGERMIDFVSEYRGSWLAISVLAAIACSNGDTWASEFGSVIGNSKPFLITGWRRVPRGTNGGISFVGTVSSALGGLAVGLAFYGCQLLSIGQYVLKEGPPQWPLPLIGLLAGFLGSLIDSVLGASLQFSGLNKKTGHVVEKPGPGVEHISGYALFDNHSVNLLSGVATSLIMPRIAVWLWEFV